LYAASQPNYYYALVTLYNNLQVLAELIKLQARQKETEDKLKELASENKVTLSSYAITASALQHCSCSLSL
jgi:hypothetical protein